MRKKCSGSHLENSDADRPDHRSGSTSTVRRYARRLAEGFKKYCRAADAISRSRAVEMIEYEVDELENLFGLLVAGAFIGIPSPPAGVTMALLPELEPVLMKVMQKISTAHDPLGDLFSVLRID